MPQEAKLGLDYNSPKGSYDPVKAKAHTPPYKIHKYFARRPWNVFFQLVDRFSKKNDIILDPFCGGGVTIFEGIRNKRKVIGCDINPLSILIVRNMTKSLKSNKGLVEAFRSCEDYLKYLYGDYYTFAHKGDDIEIEWVEMSFVVECVYCGEDFVLSNENKLKNGVYKCGNKSCSSNVKGNGVEARVCERKGFKPLFVVGYGIKRKKIIKPFDQSDERKLNNHIRFLKDETRKKKVRVPKDKIPLDWDRQLEDQLEKKGIINFQDFFTDRNLAINLLLLEYIKSMKKDLSPEEYGLLRLVFSNTIKETNIMSFTTDTWQSGKPTTWSKHAYWIPSQFCEVNVLDSFKKAEKRILSTLDFNKKYGIRSEEGASFEDLANKKDLNMLLFDKSVASLGLPEESIDSIITDPPYGSNVQYLELSHFWYPWNKDLYDSFPDFSEEAVSNRKKNFNGSKSMYDYEENLYRVFKEAHRTLKAKKYMVLTFNNKNINAWLALLFSIFKAGFSLEDDGIYYQDGVDNYRQTAHTRFKGSPYGDFIYVFKKDETSDSGLVYDSDKKFWEDLDNIFTKKVAENKDIDDKNNILLDMFLEAMPIIQSFSRTYLRNNEHGLYDIINKNYFKNLYAQRK